jgi:hypothetical protein
MKALVDNDILLKGTEYGLLSPFATVIPGKDGPVGVLGAARYVVQDRLSRRSTECSAIQEFLRFLGENIELEPTPEEQNIASVIESCAQRAGVDLDAGESQLCAVLISREVPLFVTGDKRAICAIDVLLDAYALLAAAAGRVICLEQLICKLLETLQVEAVRKSICNKPNADKALSICFCCKSSADASKDNILAGITSYVEDLRTKAPRVLFP